MKRIILLLLILLFLLSGCVQRPPVSVPNTEPSQNSITQPTIDPDLSLIPKPFDFSRNVNYTVATDFSRYAPKKQAQVLYTRLSEEPIPKLQPSQDYGAIYPLAGNTVYSFHMTGYTYGMVDEKGRIVLDPCCTDIRPLQNSYFLDFLETAPVYFPMWVLQQGNDFGEERFALASLDGSFVTEFCYTGAAGFEDYAIAIQEEENTLRFDMFSAKGDLLLSSEDLPQFQKIPLSQIKIYYSDGMLRICGSKEEFWQTLHYYMDLQGKTLLGPYTYGTDFQDGCAAVYLDEEQCYGLINTKGEILQKYASFMGFFDSAAIVEKEGGKKQYLISTTGKVLREFDPSGYSTWDGEQFYYSTGALKAFYNGKGEELYGGFLSDDCKALSDGMLLSPGLLENTKNSTQIVLPEGINGTYSLHYLGEECPYFILNRWTDHSCSLLTEEFQWIFQDRPGSMDFVTDRVSGNSYVLFYNSAQRELYSHDPSAAPISLPGTRNATVNIYNGRIFYADDSLCAYYDLQGKLLFSYPLPSFGED